MQNKGSENKKVTFFRIFTLILGMLALSVIALYCGYMLWEKAPEVREEPPALASDAENTLGQDTPELPAAEAERQGGVYTVLLVGNDDGNGNTDTIIVGRIDADKHTMDFISIPRDTYANINWDIRKINAIYWGTVNSGGVGIDGLKAQIRNLIGFDVDCYAVIDLGVFVDVINALGGVYFDVPMDMNYDDPGQNLHIHVPAGYQLLNGEQAMGVVRFRSGYIDGDLGRVQTQQKFLKAVAEQFITLGNIPNISKVVELLDENLDTDMSAANIAFFLRQALLCKSEDINFHTMPNNPEQIHGLSYTLVDLYPWLEMVNEHLNPYDTPITEENVNIVYRSGGIRCTGALQGEWYLYYDPTPAAPPIAETPPQSETPTQEDSITIVTDETEQENEPSEDKQEMQIIEFEE